MDESYLKKYHKDIQILNDAFVVFQLPPQWKNIFQEDSRSVRVEKTITLWKSCMEGYLDNVIAYLEENLYDVTLVEYSNRKSIIYSVYNTKGKLLYYEGRLPKAVTSCDFPQTLNNENNPIKLFYEKLHNGFVYYASQNMGLNPIEKIDTIDFDDFEIIQELDIEIKISLGNSYIFFSSGLGAYVVVDFMDNSPFKNASVWFNDKEPWYNVDFWDIIDIWIKMGFEL